MFIQLFLLQGHIKSDWGKDELNIANELLNKKLTLSISPYSGMHVPSESEIIIEGRILKDKTHKEWMVEMLRTYDFKRVNQFLSLIEYTIEIILYSMMC